MAIKSEKLTPFGGILSIMEKFGSVNRAVTQFSLHYHSFFMPPFYLLIVCFDMLLNLLYSPVVMACRC